MENSQETPRRDIYTEEKEHYKSLIDLFDKAYKFSLGLLTTILAIVGAAVFFVTYKSTDELRKSVEDEKQRLRSELASVREELKESRQEIERKASTMEHRVETSVTESKEIVNKAETDAVTQIGAVRSLAVQTAKNEANRSIEKAFEEDNVRKLVENTAQRKLGTELDGIVKRQVSKTTEYLDGQTEQALQLSEAKTYANVGMNFGFIVLDSLARHSLYPLIRKQATNTLQGWTTYLIREYIPNKDGEIQKDIDAFFVEYSPNFKLTKDPNEVITALVEVMRDKNASAAGQAFVLLNIMSDGQVKIFDYQSLNKWYELYKRGEVKIKPYK